MQLLRCRLPRTWPTVDFTRFLDNQLADGELAVMQGALRAARNPAGIDTTGDERSGDYFGYFVPQLRAKAYQRLLDFLGGRIGNRGIQASVS